MPSFGYSKLVPSFWFTKTYITLRRPATLSIHILASWAYTSPVPEVSLGTPRSWLTLKPDKRIGGRSVVMDRMSYFCPRMYMRIQKFWHPRMRMRIFKITSARMRIFWKENVFQYKLQSMYLFHWHRPHDRDGTIVSQLNK